ncbi:CRISPR-associated endoribonuclease Cas6 [Neomegalonema sp.]|uniref:CRISPR-associated endoribonuclease Cas6 n=1 Tax=Neomegalonema sp. TaxID=2039713 RepID=UPI00261743E9|nr:CRISPR-associated endoribonuclease Cas6 [Neomegalonema sp.]MDD2867477.1 CRISPR-associated endoribonuclease Cas6 [Neomegalonema sp.]
MRIRIDFKGCVQHVSYVDSMNAALVAGLTEAGLTSEQVVGEQAYPWTFGMEAFSAPGRKRRVRSVVVSSPHPAFAEVLPRLDAAKVKVRSCNGDVIDGAEARILPCDDLAPGADEIMIGFISPFILPAAKEGKSKTRFHEELPVEEAPAALKAGLDRRAGRELALEIVIDPLTARTDGRKKHLIHIRRFPNGRSMILPGFAAPMTLRGAPEDVRFAYLAGFGAKTRAGNGCPALMS